MVDIETDKQGLRIILRLLPAQCRAARGLLDWTQERLAATAGVSRSTVRDFECSRHELHRSTEDLLIGALEGSGIRFLDAADGGPGVRLGRPCEAAAPQARNRH